MRANAEHKNPTSTPHNSATAKETGADLSSGAKDGNGCKPITNNGDVNDGETENLDDNEDDPTLISLVLLCTY